MEKLMVQVQKYIAENKQRFLDELLEMLRIPSVSADPKYKTDVANTAMDIMMFSPQTLLIYGQVRHSSQSSKKQLNIRMVPSLPEDHAMTKAKCLCI
jgi:hypothetical protein